MKNVDNSLLSSILSVRRNKRDAALQTKNCWYKAGAHFLVNKAHASSPTAKSGCAGNFKTKGQDNILLSAAKEKKVIEIKEE
eukprot:snap_masked-scaffold_28-processed-gene-2.21-mRNA-1 protein AED:1.00 eAED:1.00 QI:0/0/0/0/1/1/2/0/81